MTTLARLTCWIDPDRSDDFVEACERRLAPRLRALGLEVCDDPGRPTVAGAFTHLWEVASPAEFMRAQLALQRDAAWREALRALAPTFAPDPGATAAPGVGRTESEPSVDAVLRLYDTEVGTGTVRPIGPGWRRGNWFNYGVQDGIPLGLRSILEDDDGRLWLATLFTDDGGVCCFDGGEIRRFDPRDGLPSGRILGACFDRAGGIWFATAEGVCRLDGERFTTFDRADGLPADLITCAHRDRDGVLWFGTPRGLCRFDGTRWTPYTTRHGLVADQVGRIFEDPGGRLWVTAGGGYSDRPGLSSGDGEGFRDGVEAAGPRAENIIAMAWDEEGAGWAGTASGDIGPFGDAGFVPEPEGVGDRIHALAVHQGVVWCATQTHGVLRLEGPRRAMITINEGLANNQVYTIHRDGRGLVWFGTFAGLSRCDEACVVTFTDIDGLPDNGVMSLLEDRDGGVWSGTWHGASRHDATGLTVEDAVDGWHVWAMAQDRQGRLWFGDAFGRGLLCREGDRIRRFTEADGLPDAYVRTMLVDHQDHLWIGTGTVGVCRYDGDTFRVRTEGVPMSLWCCHEDDAGCLWFGSHGQGLCRIDGERVDTFTRADGLPADEVACVLADGQGRVLIGTSAGLCVWDGTGFSRVHAEHGPASVSHVLRDGAGHLWIAGDGVITRTDGQVYQTLGRDDGIASDQVHDLLQDRHGDIWIATEGGVTRYRPQATPPTVRLVSVTADRRHEPGDVVQLPSSRGLVTFEFAGRSWTTKQDRIVYECRLEGLDDGWRFVTGSHAEYQDLPEGDYTFRVRAVDRDLNRSPEATVAVQVVPDARVAGLADALRQSGPGSDFIGRSPGLRQMQQQLRQVADTDLPVLIQGETGTGKGLAARAVHDHGRHDGPFIAINCGGVPEALFDSELFGHERGAFTGAVSRRLGKVELAAGGTLFLDEIGDMPPETQVKLLRLLQEGTFERVGGAQTLTARVRVVSATNRDLPQMVEAGRFRADLYFRLEGFRVALPPLRERRQDIELLALHFLGRMARHIDKDVRGLSPETLPRLQDYAWPGNVRELEHAMQRAVVMCRGPEVRPDDLGLGGDINAPAPPLDTALTLDDVERRHIAAVLQEADWVIKGPKGAARRLGLSATALRRRIEKHGLSREASPGGATETESAADH